MIEDRTVVTTTNIKTYNPPIFLDGCSSLSFWLSPYQNKMKREMVDVLCAQIYVFHFISMYSFLFASSWIMRMAFGLDDVVDCGWSCSILDSSSDSRITKETTNHQIIIATTISIIFTIVMASNIVTAASIHHCDSLNSKSVNSETERISVRGQYQIKVEPYECCWQFLSSSIGLGHANRR